MSSAVPQTIDLLVQYRLATTAEYDWSDIRIRYPILFHTLYISSFSRKKPITEATEFSDLYAYLKTDLSLLGVVIDHFIYHRNDISSAITVVPVM